MYLLAVSPFSKSFRKNELWYFSQSKIEAGKIVTIELRNKKIKGIVMNCKLAKNNKTEIKKSGFSLKKILGVSKYQLLSPAFIRASETTANYFAVSSGGILNSLIPKNILEEHQKFSVSDQKVIDSECGKFVVQLPDDERFSEYKSLIRGRFAKNGSVFFVVPTNEDIDIAKQKLSKGIEANTVILKNQMPKKKFQENWNKILESKKSLLVITTPQYLFSPVNNIALIIIERENSNAYKTMNRPHFDMRFFIEEYAKELGADFLLGDLMLRSETLQRYDENVFFEYTPIKFRMINNSRNILIDMKEEDQKQFRTISTKTMRVIEDGIISNKQSFLLVARKGLSPMITCGDCGQIVKCNDCDSNMTLYGKDATKKENLFKCRNCNATRSAGETCKNCSSWRLVTLGIGTEKVYQDLEEAFPDAKLFLIDKEHTKTPIQARRVIKEFYEEPAGILIGTEMALQYLNENIDNTIVISIDSLFSIPDYKIKERILNILLKTKIKSQDNFIIQTRNIEDKVFNQAIEGNLSDFYREEFYQRKKYLYPPFSLMIKLKFKEKTKAKINKIIEESKEILRPFEILVYDSFLEKRADMLNMNAIIKIKRKEWPNSELIEKLKQLPMNVDFIVDADSAL